MKKTIQMEETPAGYCLNAVEAGGTMQIEYRGFSLSSYGKDFIRKVEGYPQQIMNKAFGNIHPSDIKSFIAIINSKNEIDVYLNEVEILAQAVVSKAISVGDPVRKNDIYHIDKVEFEGVNFPKDCSYMVLINNGWDRVFCFDFGPSLKEEIKPINYEVGTLIGAALSKSIFYDIFDLDEKEWRVIIESNWFPFSFIDYDTQKKLLNSIKHGWNVNEIEEGINTNFVNSRADWIEELTNNTKLNNHIATIKKAINYHVNGDYEGAMHLLYPKIEAILRDDFIRSNPEKEGRRQDALSDHIPKNITDHTHSISRFFPEKFSEYMLRIFFKDFDVNGENKFVSRNTISHGVVDPSSFTMKSSLIGFLILDQVHRYTHFSSNFVIKGLQED